MSFKDEKSVAALITENVSESGVYILPNTYCFPDGLSKEEQKQWTNQGMKAMKQGPMLFTVIKKEGFDGMAPSRFIISLFVQMIGAFLITALVWHTKGLNYFGKVAFVTATGFIVAWLSSLPNWNWLGYPLLYILINMADLVIAWFLAGLVIATVARRNISHSIDR